MEVVVVVWARQAAGSSATLTLLKAVAADRTMTAIRSGCGTRRCRLIVRHRQIWRWQVQLEGRYSMAHTIGQAHCTQSYPCL